MNKGKLLVVEGVDSSGKKTQAELLYNKLLSEGKKVKLITFPNYESPSSSLVKMYLNGDFGENPDEVNVYASSTFYAVDRFASFKTDWEGFYNDGGIIISDRYTTSNMVHQASKIKDKDKKDEYLDWLWELEFNLYKLPVPDMVIFLDVEPSTSIKLMGNRPNKITNESTKDIHEKNQEYLINSYLNALYVAKKYDWKRINCNTNDNNILGISVIHEKVYDAAKTMLEAN